MIAKACVDEDAYQLLLKVTALNIQAGDSMQFGGPCSHRPSCPTPTDEQLAALNERLRHDLASPELFARKVEPAKLPGR